MKAEELAVKPYHIELVFDQDEDGSSGWVAEVEELPGCIAQGQTADEAVKAVRKAMVVWIAVALKDGVEVPPPRDGNYSGRFLVRVPSSLHAELSRAAKREKVSLNSYAMSTLASAVGWPRRLPDSVRPVKV